MHFLSFLLFIINNVVIENNYNNNNCEVEIKKKYILQNTQKYSSKLY